MKIAIKILIYEIAFALKLISREEFADKKCYLSYLLASEASRDFHKSCLNKR
jgi:hypothetical protein